MELYIDAQVSFLDSFSKAFDLMWIPLELKELIAMHGSHEAHGGDLKTDTVTIIGATLDLQEKVVRQASIPSCASHRRPFNVCLTGNDTH